MITSVQFHLLLCFSNAVPSILPLQNGETLKTFRVLAVRQLLSSSLSLYVTFPSGESQEMYKLEKVSLPALPLEEPEQRLHEYERVLAEASQ